MKCVADALFLAIRNYHTRKASQKLSRGWCSGEVYTVSVGVPMANQAIMHTFRLYYIFSIFEVELCQNPPPFCQNPSPFEKKEPPFENSWPGNNCFHFCLMTNVSPIYCKSHYLGSTSHTSLTHDRCKRCERCYLKSVIHYRLVMTS